MTYSWVRRLVRGPVGPTNTNTTHQQYFLVSQCALVNKPCMVDAWVDGYGSMGVEWWVIELLVELVYHGTTTPTTNIPVLNDERQRTKSCMVDGCVQVGVCGLVC